MVVLNGLISSGWGKKKNLRDSARIEINEPGKYMGGSNEIWIMK